VADRAVAVQADELVRKPFQPQELIGRVRSLLNANKAVEPLHLDQPSTSSASLDSLFAPPPVPPAPAPVATMPPPPTPTAVPPTVYAKTGGSESVWPRALAEAFVQQSQQAAPPASRPITAADIHKFRAEIACLELLVKKLQTELQIERQYNQALEQHVRTLTQVD
jgi:DNA-binding response OmpR family regulator